MKTLALLLLLLAPGLAHAVEMGTVHVLHVHPATGAAYYDISVERDRGGRCQVSRSAAPDPRYQEGDRVQMTPGPCGIAPLRVLKAGLQVARVAGVQPTVVILVNFTNDRSEPQTRALIQSWMFYADVFVREQSYGTVSMPYDVVGWYPLAMANTGCSYWNIQTAADRAAAAAGVNLSSYMRRIYIWPYTAQCPFGGLGTVGGNPSSVWINGQYGVLNHEVGHTLGLYHSHGLRCGTWPTGTPLTPPCVQQEYGDIRDTMGGSGGPFNSFQKMRLGWLGQSGVPDVIRVTQSGDYMISDYQGPVTSVAKALVIPRGTTGEMFYVEEHAASPERLPASVYVRLAHPSLPDSSKFLDLTPSVPFGLDSRLVVGARFTDPVSGVQLSTISADAAGAVIRVALSGAPPPPPPPPPPVDGGILTLTSHSPIGREMTFHGTITTSAALTATVDGVQIAARYIVVDRLRKTWSAKASGLLPGQHLFVATSGLVSVTKAFAVLK